MTVTVKPLPDGSRPVAAETEHDRAGAISTATAIADAMKPL
jgi:hypothetical protein